MTQQRTVAVGRRSARAILIDSQDRLVLIKRTKPGQPPYWTAPGGGVEDTDPSLEATLYRELGAEIDGALGVFLTSSRSETGVAVQYFFLARLARLDAGAHCGPEFADPPRGGYEVDRVSLDALG